MEKQKDYVILILLLDFCDKKPKFSAAKMNRIRAKKKIKNII